MSSIFVAAFELLLIIFPLCTCSAVRLHTTRPRIFKIDNEDYNSYLIGNRKLFDSIMSRLRLRPSIVEFLRNRFQVADRLQLIYPDSLGDVERQGECLLRTRMIDNKTGNADNVLVKVQRDEAVKAWMSERKRGGGSGGDEEAGRVTTRKTYCAARDLSAIRNCLEKLVPIEFHAARLIELNRVRGFFQFYPDYSLPLSSSSSTSSAIIGTSPMSRSNNYYYYYNFNAQILTFMHHSHTQDLKSWYASHHRTEDFRLDRKLKRIFRQMHAALVFLLNHNLVYTDFKPTNVLVNLNNKKGSAFLTRLDAIVTLGKDQKLDTICQISLEYFPPVYGAQSSANAHALPVNRLIDSFLKLESTEESIDRLLSWQFCLTLYSLVCSDTFESRLSSFSDRTVFNGWRNDDLSLANHLNCSGKKLPDNMESLFDSCLYRKSRTSRTKKSFHRLIDHEWFEDYSVSGELDLE